MWKIKFREMESPFITTKAPRGVKFDPKIRSEVMKLLGIEKCSVDLFAEEVNALELDFITRKRVHLRLGKIVVGISLLGEPSLLNAF